MSYAILSKVVSCPFPSCYWDPQLLGSPWSPFLVLGLGSPWPLFLVLSQGSPWPPFLVLGLGAPWSPFLVLGLGAPGLLSLKVVSILAEVSLTCFIFSGV